MRVRRGRWLARGCSGEDRSVGVLLAYGVKTLFEVAGDASPRFAPASAR